MTGDSGAQRSDTTDLRSKCRSETERETITCMADRLSPLDVSFLYLEGARTPMHVGGLAIFSHPKGGFDYDSLASLIEKRISLVPRYRQKIKWVPGHLASPVWVDDSGFDLSYHVRRSALPRPGSDDQLRELVARVQSRPLDRNRPLWEMYLVEDLADDRFAIITKTHHAMVDGISAIDISQVILDATRVPRDIPEDLWMPRAEPGAVALIVDAVTELVHRPTAVIDTARIGLADVRNVTSQIGAAVGGLLAAARIAARPAPMSPLNAIVGSQRRFATARTDLDDYKKVRKEFDGTVNDVVLATVAGAIRGWLLSRGESVMPATSVRAMVPVSVRGDSESEQLGNRVSSYLVDLPVGEPNPVVRLSQVSYAMKAHKESGQSVGADALVALSGFAPPTLHAMGARAASSFTRRLFNVVVTNVPGPQFPLYAAGAKLLEMYPVVPLASGQALSIGLTSYDGDVYFGLNADRDAMYDADVFASLIEESLAELVEAAEGPRKRRR
ncbi:MAG: diacylglycerol O-acyltransferase / wax synthase [Pseudonocardiales bacterium]|jgi:WS/DGAT/MGAT family acyltransferase|nr:diacylglycerol O-acyltransferase / wax synthase [Pseudonocardiales bacterium]